LTHINLPSRRFSRIWLIRTLSIIAPANRKECAATFQVMFFS
jgi:hypothetical protein